MLRFFNGLILLGGLLLWGCEEPVNQEQENVIGHEFQPINLEPEIEAGVLEYLEERTLWIFHENGDPVEDHLAAGERYFLGVRTEGIESARNQISLFHGNHHDAEQGFKLVDFYWDPDQAWNANIEVPEGLDLFTLAFYVPDLQVLDETGVLKLSAWFKKPENERNYPAIRYFNLLDPTPDSAKVMRVEEPPMVKRINFAYLGRLLGEERIADLKRQFEARFIQATKGYVEVELNDLGRRNYPEDGEEFAGVVHDYTAWWNRVSHNYEGTELQGLDLNDPEDFELIKMAWYSAHRLQMGRDIEALFGLSELEEESMVFVEVGYWASGGRNFATVALYNSVDFHAHSPNGVQWGKHPDFDLLSDRAIIHYALHELGHVMGGDFNHPGQDDIPGDPGLARVYHESFEVFTYTSHTGVLDDYVTDVFFRDEGIVTVSEFRQREEVAARPQMRIPYIDPLDDTIHNVQWWDLTGKKDANSGIRINGVDVVQENEAQTWSARINLIPGLNRFEVSQTQNGLVSHPQIVFLNTVFDHIDGLPILDVVPGFAGTAGFSFANYSFDLRMTAAAGLDYVSWHIEKEISPGVFEVVPGEGHMRKLNQSTQASVEYAVGFKEAGTYKLVAHAVDYPRRTAGIQLSTDTVEVVYQIQER